MDKLTPKTVTPINTTPHVTQRTMNLSSTPLPDDMRSIILEHFNFPNTDPETLEIVYQYILSKSPTGEIDDIKQTAMSLANKLQLSDGEMFKKIRDLAVKELSLNNPAEQIDMKRSVVEKELPALERQAQETGDWRFYLRASQKKDELGAVSDIERKAI